MCWRILIPICFASRTGTAFPINRPNSLNVWFGFEIGGNLDTYRSRIPTDQPLLGTIDELGWLTVFNEATVSRLGGAERVLNVPAWRTKQLDSGHVLIVTTDHPLEPIESPSESPAQHLLTQKIKLST